MAKVAAVLLALLACLLPAAPAAGQTPEPVPTLGDRAGSNVQAACRRAEGPCPKPDIAAYERSDTHRALAFQYRLGHRVPLRNAQWVGTHNSSNTATEPFTLSGSDHNQQISMTDQLRLDVRSLELDLHLVRGTVMVCHGLPASQMHAGCTNERPLADRLAELRPWFDENPGEVVLLYLEDHVGPDGHGTAARIIQDHLGDLLYRPAAGGCSKLPLDLTRAAVRRAGKQVVLVSGCGQGNAWPGIVFDWTDHLETRPRGYRADCGPDFTRRQYDAEIVRYFEDSTVVTATAQHTGRTSLDDGLTPETTAAMVRCGVDLFGFDQLLPDDGRLDALVWSWAPHPRRCAVQGEDGYWEPERCRARRPFACRGREGWLVTRATGRRRKGRRACRAARARFVPPRTGYENAQLAVTAAGERPWLAYTPPLRMRGRS